MSVASFAYGEQKFGDQRFGAQAPVPSPTPALRDLERQYHVVLQDSLGHPALGFRDGTWFRITVSGPQPLQLRGAIRHCPHAAGSIVQIACWWMRENPLQPRSLDLATELALTVGELVRVCPADGLGSSSQDLAPLAAMAVAPAMPPVAQPMPIAAAAQSALPAAPAYSQQPAAMAAGYSQQQPVGMPGAPAAGSWFDPLDTSTAFPSIPPAPVMPQQNGAAYPAAPTSYGAAPQSALPPAAAYPQQAPARPAAAPPARGYGDSQQADWERQGAPRRPAANDGQVRAQPGQAAQQPRPVQGPPRPRGPQQQRPEFRDERRDTFERRLGLEEEEMGPDRSSDRLDRSGDRLDRSSDRVNGVPPRRPNPNPNANPQPRGTMGRRPATRPGRQSDW